MSNLLVIPARYDSSRFPGKPLAYFEDYNGKKISLQQAKELTQSK